MLYKVPFVFICVDKGNRLKKQGRPLDYGQVTDKVIYRFQRPSTQQEFATALVDFLSQYRSKAAKGAGPQNFLTGFTARRIGSLLEI